MKVTGSAPTSVPIQGDAPRFADLLELHRALGLAGSPLEVAQASLDVALRVLHAQGAAIALAKDGEVVTFASRGHDLATHGHTPLEANVPACETIRSGKPAFFADERAAREAPPDIRGQGELGARAVLPLQAGAATWGVLSLSWRAARPFPAEAQGGLMTFAALVAQSLWRARQTEEANRARAEFEDFVGTASVGLHFVAADGTILWANEADHALLGRSREEYVGHNIAEFHADQDNLNAILACLTDGKRIVNRSAALRHKDGSLRTVLIDSSARFVEGKFAHTRCFTRDVTALWEQAERHDALLRAQDAMGDAILLLEGTRIVWVNEATTRLMGYSAAELTAASFDRRVLSPPDERAKLEKRAQARREGEASERYLTRLIRKDGSLRHVEVSFRIVNARQRVAVVRDVTQRETALARLTSIIGAAPIQIVILDRHGVIETINNTPTGHSLDHVPGRSIFEVAPPEYLARIEPPIRAALERGRPGEYEIEVEHPEGRRWMHVRVSPLLEGGEVQGALILSSDVSSLKRAELALGEQRDLDEALLRAQSDLDEGMVLAWEGKVVYANEAILRMLGVSREDLTRPGFDMRDMLAPDVAQQARGLLDGRDPSTPLHYRTSYIRADGRRIEVEVASVGVNHKGAFQRLALFRDVTRQHEAEERIHKRDAFLTEATLRLLESTLDPDATLELVARLATRRLGDVATVDIFEADSRTRRVVIAHADPGQEELARAHVASHEPSRRIRELAASIPRGEVLLSNGIDLARVAQTPRADADAILLRRLGIRHSMLVPLWGRTGLVGAIGLGRTRDEPLTEEDVFVAKNLATRAVLAYENALLHDETKKLESAWRALYERYERLIQTAPAHIVAVNAQGRIASVNRTIQGEPRESHIGRDAFRDLSPEERPRIERIVLDAIATRTPAAYETEAWLPSGERRWMQASVGPVDLEDGPGALLVITDIDDKKRGEREIASMRAQLIQGEKMSALGSLVSGVAHELRTPLTFLSNNAFLLKRRLDDATRRGHVPAEARADVDRFLAEITTGVDRINQLVEDLRRYTKARQDATIAALPMNEPVGDAVELFRATNRTSHRIEAALNRTEPVRVNVGALQQIVLNLLQNAADATPPGGLIRVVTRDDEQGATLEVTDEGIGIPQDVQERMFEPLFTTKREGTGLGLSIVKRIADEHHATIECDSEPGRGTRFVLRFPRA